MTIKKPIVLELDAALFDVDGTIIDSSAPIAEFWEDFGKDKPYLDVQEVIGISHGWRTFDVMKKFAPDFAIPEVVTDLEGSIPDNFGSSVKEIPGATKLLSSIFALDLENERLAVATSGTYAMASKWFKILNMQIPKVFVTAESVKRGKPDPEPYLLARKRLGHDESWKKIVVFEDAPAGIEAGRRAGCLVIGIASTYDVNALKGFGADIVVKDMTQIKVAGFGSKQDHFKLLIREYEYVDTKILDRS